MKIRILNADKMHCRDLEAGQVVEVFEDGQNTYRQVNGYYAFYTGWKDKYFEIIEEKDLKMNQSINNVKIRVNNPDHSKAIQEWLFERGCYWEFNGETLQDYPCEALEVGVDTPFVITWTSEGDVEDYFEWLDLQHLDPHLQKPFKETVKIHTQTDPQYNQANMLQKHLKHLSQLEHAIERHDNKQNKRRQERQKLLEMINKEMPKRVKVVTEETLKPF